MQHGFNGQRVKRRQLRWRIFKQFFVVNYAHSHLWGIEPHRDLRVRHNVDVANPRSKFEHGAKREQPVRNCIETKLEKIAPLFISSQDYDAIFNNRDTVYWYVAKGQQTLIKYNWHFAYNSLWSRNLWAHSAFFLSPKTASLFAFHARSVSVLHCECRWNIEIKRAQTQF